MTENELRLLIAKLVTEEFDKHTTAGMLPINTDQSQVQFLFDVTVDGIFQMIMLNPHLKAKLPTTNDSEIEAFIKRMMEESDRRARDTLNMPYGK